MTRLSTEWADKEILLAQEISSPYTPFNRQNNPSAFDAVKGTDAGVPEVEVGKDPEEVFEQLKLPLDLAAHDKQDDTAPDGYDPLTGLEWKIGPDGKPHFVYPDDEPPIVGIDLDKAEADLFQRIQEEQTLADVRPGMLGIPGSEEEGTKFPMPIIEGEFPGDPGIGPDSVPTPTEQYYDPVQTLAELNPAQIKVLEGIPKDINSWPSDKRLKKMKEITEKVKGLA